ncbi:uncharacterized protein EV422DRAFT_508019 [Fimicolochytrium jonesii]|uniref:uncharacterized protein n=1 Tax=Fimicolochytrium jonesii TaxID=1396493 RepID=UPI0022FDEC08|nr:uncharacterized protein EV422DRAFT_508019 [Fimicolochytrium jonesii]KAI8818481.1 hypothetical protein EV422DRAFT_508019 [Fimicolochytrium jonesii]
MTTKQASLGRGKVVAERSRARKRLTTHFIHNYRRHPATWTFTLLVLLTLFAMFPPARGQYSNSDTKDSDTVAITVAVRTQRDLSLSLPANRASGAGLVLDPLVLNGNYTLTAFAQTQRLLSGLFRRIVLDLYWDNRRKAWQTCPVAYSDSVWDEAIRLGADAAMAKEMSMGNETAGTVVSAFPTWLASQENGGSQNTVLQLILNLHDLGTTYDASITPGSTRNLSQTISSNKVYTPVMLKAFRDSNATDSPYHTIPPNTDPTLPIAARWPLGKDLVASGTQVLIAFGTNNLNATSGYDTTADADFIFPAAEMSGIPPLTTADIYPGSQLTSCANPGPGIAMLGTGFDLANPNFTASAAQLATSTRNISFSWPYVAESTAKPFDQATVERILQCGFFPLFSVGVPQPLVQASTWSWEANQPAQWRGYDCAVMERDTGKWTVDRCDTHHPVACHLTTPNHTLSNPYTWYIHPTPLPFTSATTACPAPYTFTPPETSPQSHALHTLLLSTPHTHIWISLHQPLPTCWVNGLTGSCPYTVTDDSYQAYVGATLKQGIVIVVLGAVFVFFRCRRQVRVARGARRKAEVARMVRGVEVVTVPVRLSLGHGGGVCEGSVG